MNCWKMRPYYLYWQSQQHPCLADSTFPAPNCFRLCTVFQKWNCRLVDFPRRSSRQWTPKYSFHSSYKIGTYFCRSVDSLGIVLPVYFPWNFTTDGWLVFFKGIFASMNVLQRSMLSSLILSSGRGCWCSTNSVWRAEEPPELGLFLSSTFFLCFSELMCCFTCEVLLAPGNACSQ